MAILYEDERVICDQEGILIKDFYQPLDGDKKIAYSNINNIKVKRLNPLAGLSQIWGQANKSLQNTPNYKNYWFGFDLKRLFKSKAIIIDEGNLVKSVITPEDVERVFKILEAKILSGNK